MSKPTQFFLLLSPSEDVSNVDLYSVNSHTKFGSEKAATKAFDKVYFATCEMVHRANPEWNIDDVLQILSAKYGWFVQRAAHIHRVY